MIARARRALRSDRGSVTVWIVESVVAMILIVGIAVDLTGQVSAKERVADVAAQAARAGGQQLQQAATLTGDTSLNVDQAVAAAQSYLAASAVTGTVSVNGDTVVVDATTTYSTIFLGIVGIDTITVAGQGQAQTVRAIGGAAG